MEPEYDITPLVAVAVVALAFACARIASWIGGRK